MRILTTTLSALLLALAIALPVRAASTDLTQDQRLETVMGQLQDVITQLSYSDSLSRTETDTLRRTLAGLYRDLQDIKGGVVAGYPDYGTGDNSADTWTRFGDAALKLNPVSSRFTGWKTGNTIRVGYGDGTGGLIYLTVANGPYTARWTLHNAYNGGVHTTVKAESTGDVRLTVEDDNGTHEFLVKDGGLGPIYSRNWVLSGKSTSPVIDGRTAGVWYKVYRDQVSRRTMRESVAMTWLLQQYQDNSFVNAKVRNFGAALGDLEGTPLSTGPIGTLTYEQDGRPYELDIPDPRRDPGAFAGFAKILYDLDQNGETYDFDLPTY